MEKNQKVIAPQFGFGNVKKMERPKLELVKVEKIDDEFSALEMAKSGWVVVVENAKTHWTFGFHRPLKSDEEMGRIQIRQVLKREIRAFDKLAKRLLKEKNQRECQAKRELLENKWFMSLSIGELEQLGCSHELMGRGGEKNSVATVKFKSPDGKFSRERPILFWATPWGLGQYMKDQNSKALAGMERVMRAGKTARDHEKGGPRNPTGRGAILGPKKGPSPQADNKGFKKKK